MLLIAAVSAVFIYFRTDPANRGTTFWISVGFLGFALILETLQASGIAMRSNSGRNIPVSFSKLILLVLCGIVLLVLSMPEEDNIAEGVRDGGTSKNLGWR